MAKTPFQMSRRTFLGTSIAVAAWPATATSPAFAASPSPNRLDASSLLASFDDRANAVLQEFAAADPDEITNRSTYVKTATWYAQARLHLGLDETRAFEIIEDVTDGDKAGGARWARVAAIDSYLRFGDQYPAQLRDKTRNWLTQMDAGNIAGTLNHKFMGAAALYLVAQTWPDQDNAAAKLAAAEAYFTQRLDDIVRFGWWEYGSPVYTSLYTTTLLTLADHAGDPVMKQRALMALEWFLITVGTQWVDGYWVSPTSRTNSTFTGPDWPGQGATSLGWLFFGGRQPQVGAGMVLYAGSPYRIPAILDSIVLQRSVPLVHLESQDMLLRHLGSDDPRYGANTAGFAITTYLTSGYGVASQFDGYQTFMDVKGDLASQSLRWLVRWASPEIGSTLHFHHPRPDNLEHDAENNAKYFYVGTTPHEQVLQHNGVILVVYDIPNNHPAGFIRGPVTTPAVQESIKHESGWIFNHGGSILIAIRPLRPYTLEERELHGICSGEPCPGLPPVPIENLQSDGRKNGVIVETAAPAAYASLQQFADVVLAATSIDASGLDNEDPSFSYTTLAGDTLGITFNGDRTVNGVPVDYDAWPLIDNPYAHQEVGGDILTLTFGSQQRTYNFATLETLDVTGIGRPASASSTASGHPAELGNDGLADTRWAASDGSMPQWWQVDLENAADVDGIALDLMDDRTYGYRVLTSTDGQIWTTAVDNTANTVVGDQHHTFSPRQARYVRVEITSASVGWATLFEVRVLTS